MAYRCMKCRKVHPDAVVDEWGSHPFTHGLGNQPRCVGVVPARGRPTTADGGQPGQVCLGQLMYDSATPNPA